MSLYFAYGSNMDRAGMAVRCPGATALGPAVLNGYRFFIGAGGWASAEPADHDAVWGVLWRITDADRRALDAYEAVDEGLYEARTVPIDRGDQAATAMTYFLRPAGYGIPQADYLALIASAARHWNFPDAYVRMIEQWAGGLLP